MYISCLVYHFFKNLGIFSCHCTVYIIRVTFYGCFVDIGVVAAACVYCYCWPWDVFAVIVVVILEVIVVIVDFVMLLLWLLLSYLRLLLLLLTLWCCCCACCCHTWGYHNYFFFLIFFSQPSANDGFEWNYSVSSCTSVYSNSFPCR